ncbi:MAG: response regulator transcription factor [Peptococcaceae bacterium]|nr:response regulator transcription factor [Peptococcaceae bacterium]
MARNMILVIENDRELLDTVVIGLRRLGFECIVYDNPKKLFDSLMCCPNYDLALINISLLKAEAFELLTYMRQHSIPAICMRDQEDIHFEIEALQAGAEDCVTKPADFGILLARIEKILRCNGNPNHVIYIRDIVLNLFSQTATRNGREILLKPKEFDLLVLLVKNKNRTLNREEILNKVWETDYFGETHTVDSHISSLRKKLGVKDLIKTIYGRGYRLEDKERGINGV